MQRVAVKINVSIPVFPRDDETVNPQTPVNSLKEQQHSFCSLQTQYNFTMEKRG